MKTHVKRNCSFLWEPENILIHQSHVSNQQLPANAEAPE
jgi:hypothetical protein